MPKKDDAVELDEVETDESQPIEDDSDLSEDGETDDFSDAEVDSEVDDGKELTWTASEFISHEKNRDWYVLWGIGAAFLTLILYLLTRSNVTALAVIVGSILLAVYAGRKPRELEYHLDSHTVTAGDQTYQYENFRSFSVIDDGAFARIDFMPLKRFSQILSIYFHPADENEIVDLLANHLPYEEREQDRVERLMRRLRF